MEFPDLGQHCLKPNCNKLDFLPIRCDACKNVFCEEHYSYTNHNCPKAYMKNNQVPVCPLCNIPIPVGPNQQPDVIIGAHIDNDCQSDHLKNKKKVFANRCSFKGCKIKEVIPIVCKECTYNFCLKHRHQADHKCEGNVAAKRKKALDAALSRRSNQSSRPSDVRQHVMATQGNLSEDEALARALALSMQEEMDFAVARQLQASENQTTATTASSSSRDRCDIS